MEDVKEINNALKMTHSIIHTILYLGLIDINILKIYFNKTSLFKIEDHLKTSISLFLLTIINFAIINYDEKNIFYKVSFINLDFVIFFFFIIQISLGAFLKNSVNENKKFIDFYSSKLLHKINAFIIVIISKFKMIVIWEYYLEMFGLKNHIQKIIYLYFYIWMSIYIFFYLFFKTRKKIALFKMAKTNAVIYWDMQNSINNNEYSDSSSGNDSDSIKSFLDEDKYKESESVELTDSDASRKESFINIKAKNEKQLYFDKYKKFFMFEDKFFELENFLHPGGNFILGEIMRKDVTRLIYGIKNLKFLSEGKIKFIKHIHDFRGFDAIKNLSIGPLKIESFFLKFPFKEKVNLHENKSLNLTDSKLQLAFAKFEKEKVYDKYQFKFEERIYLKKDIYFFLIKKSFNNLYLGIVDLSLFWVNLIGKYFILFCKDDKRFFVNSLISFNPNYLKLRNKYLNLISKKLSKFDSHLKTDLIIRIENFKDFKKDLTYSYYCSCMGFFELEESLKNFKLKGPIGGQIGFNSISTKKILVIVHNEGIICFLDFFEILIQKFILKLSEGQNLAENIKWVFGKEYLLEFENGLQITFYWFLDHNFLKQAKSFGLYHIEFLLFIQNQIQISSHIIKDFYVHNPFVGKKYKFIKNTQQQGFDILKDIILKSNFQKIILNGNDLFIQNFISKIDLDYEYLKNLFFIY